MTLLSRLLNIVYPKFFINVTTSKGSHSLPSDDAPGATILMNRYAWGQLIRLYVRFMVLSLDLQLSSAPLLL